MMISAGGAVSCSNGAGGRLMMSTVLFQWASVLLVFVTVGVIEGVPTQDFGVNQGQKEMVVMSGRSLYWPYSMGSRDYYRNAANDKRTEKRTSQSIQLCGYRLLEAVRGICRGNYVGYNRRSDPDMHEDDHITQDASDQRYNQQHQHRHQSHHRSNNAPHQQSHLRFRRNIVDECCLKSCSVNEMLRYCGRA